LFLITHKLPGKKAFRCIAVPLPIINPHPEIRGVFLLPNMEEEQVMANITTIIKIIAPAVFFLLLPKKLTAILLHPVNIALH
jgi:hypothetical protein